MPPQSNMSVEQYDQLLQAAEKQHRSVLNAVEQVLSVGDFQKQVDQPTAPSELIELTAHRVNEIIKFDVGAIYLVEENTSDIKLSCCVPGDLQKELEDQVAFLIENGYIAWAFRERRGITVYAKDQRNRVMLHVMATYSRIRGIFIGVFPVKSHRLPDGSLQVLSLLLRNASNALESLEYLEMFKRQNAELQVKVDEKVLELRRRDHQLLNAQKMDAIASLAGGVAHQYNNALAVLFANLDLIKMAAGSGQDISRYTNHIETAAEKLKDLTSKLLAYARGGKYIPEKVYIEELVEKALSSLRNAIERPVEIEITLPSQTYGVHVDVTQMQLALSAIITNASEALETGGRVCINAEKMSFRDSDPENPIQLMPGDYIVLEISDNGRGMDEVTRQHIFEPFFSTKFMGRGMSMAAAYGIVKNHHGEITVESRLGKGTTVRVYLPTEG